MENTNRTTRTLKVLGRVINIVVIIVNGLGLLSTDSQVQRLGLMFNKL